MRGLLLNFAHKKHTALVKFKRMTRNWREADERVRMNKSEIPDLLHLVYNFPMHDQK